MVVKLIYSKVLFQNDYRTTSGHGQCICIRLLLQDEIKLHFPRMQCKSDNMAPKFGLFSPKINGRKYPLY